MNKEQIFEVLTLIKDFYEHFEITQSKIDSWHLVLKHSDLEKVKINLLNYCKENSFPPKVADLIKEKTKILDRMNAIPDVEETRRNLDAIYSRPELTDEAKNSIEQSKAQIRKILGIG